MVERCLAEARDKEAAGDLRGAFLLCQSLLIDHYGDIPDGSMAELYAFMGRISQLQGKEERAAKYLKKARMLRPEGAETVPSSPPPLPRMPPAPPRSTPPRPLPVEQALARAAARSQEGHPAEIPQLPQDETGARREAVPTGKTEEEPPHAPPPVRPVEAETPEEPGASPVEVPADQPVRLAWVAGFWIRAAAFLVDGLIVTFLFVAMTLLSSLFLGEEGEGAFSPFFQQASALILALVVFVLLMLVYLVLFSRFGGQSAGKMLLGLRVVQLDGHSLSVQHSIRRGLGMLVAALPGLAGFFWTAFDLHRRGWHDYIGGTLVVYVRPHPDGESADKD